MELKFKAEEHVYLLDGKPIPSVTQILGQYVEANIGGIKYLVETSTGFSMQKSMMNEKADFGTAIHDACAIMLSGKELDLDKLHPDLETPMLAFYDFIQEYKVEAHIIEEPMVAKYDQVWYAGTPDLICSIYGAKFLIEIKSSPSACSMAGPQTSAYENLYRKTYRTGENLRRGVMFLNQDKNKWILKALTSAKDRRFFRAKLRQHTLKGQIS